ncbi:RDD family protein [Verrucomicrobiaceae bacterium R5-34]|uniref:RDD family protein n=1 Tax=Oceaniferula flava TaxID=2800421 RepID=A0AAE2SCY4_9BACT|nr:RDD family protein [Oceaniferula flavus]MBK1831042.1 RDD family protein [Verrucomicrobiaceae bacterium R5-34]MBK1855559.1 RDD family protein [Oceaniferula flavus]MBM1136865.1 RDD family protein [Oceaniferula flavus]
MSDQTTTDSTSPYTTPETTAPAATPAVAGSAAQATLGQRAGAYLIDVILASIVAGILSSLVGQVSSILGSLLSFTGIAYVLVRDSLPQTDGQSIGKKLLGLRAVTSDGQSLSGNWQPGLLRNVILVIPFMALVELIVLITKKDAPEGLLRLGDQWANTKVIQVPK